MALPPLRVEAGRCWQTWFLNINPPVSLVWQISVGQAPRQQPVPVDRCGSVPRAWLEVEHDGETVYFCREGCKAEFELQHA